MCGITGLWAPDDDRDLTPIISAMADTLARRGPDDRGIYISEDGALALGHRRLSVRDLSAEGHQPMHSPCGRYILVYNGEIYNVNPLRSGLIREGSAFRGHSDTEVLLEALCRWGLQKTLAQINGMFAFALWDNQNQALALVRDRLGIKPLYYGWIGNRFVFASELKALWKHPAFEPDLDQRAIALFLRYGYVPAPHAIFTGIYKLMPGTTLCVNRAKLARKAHFSPDPTQAEAAWKPDVYWSAWDTVAQQMGNPITSPEEAVEQLHQQLSEAVALRMVADVPLGAFLSGGIDSSLVVALMQANSARPVKTFTVGFGEAAYDESPYARAVAAHLGTDHTELRLAPEDAIAELPNLPILFDEPFADASQIPTLLLSRETQRHVTVCLSGDGGDELFCGYDRYRLCNKLWRNIQWMPLAIRKPLAQALGPIPERFWHGLFSRLRLQGRTSDKTSKITQALRAENPDDLYDRAMSLWDDASWPMPGIGKGGPLPSSLHPDLRDPRHRMMFRDMVSYLPDDLLTKVDRASMGVSLEVRVPMLDHRVVALAWRIPLSIHMQDGRGKWPLRQILDRYVPRHLIDRPKMGFGVPIDHWLKGPLRTWAESLLDKRRLNREGIFDPAIVHKVWTAHLSGKRQAPQMIWSLLAFQAWHEHFQH